MLPDADDQEQRFFTPAEIEALYEACDPRFRAMVLVACYAGLRIGEQAALREMDLLFASGQIHVRQGAFEPERGPVEFGPLKTRYSRGRVDVPVFLLDELTGHRKRFPSPTEGLAAGRVFTNARGGPLRPRNWRRRFWAEAVARAGLGPATPHAMRHTFVSLLIDQGLSVEKVAEQARHRDPGFTWRVYRHRFEQRAVAGASDSALAMENVRTQAVAARQPGGRRGDGPDLRLLARTAGGGVDPS
jgi:integrase